MEKYEGLSLYWPAIGGAIFMLYILIVAIIGLDSTAAIYESYLTVWCATVKFLHVMVYGDASIFLLKNKKIKILDWVGMSGFHLKLIDFNDGLSTFL